MIINPIKQLINLGENHFLLPMKRNVYTHERCEFLAFVGKICFAIFDPLSQLVAGWKLSYGYPFYLRVKTLLVLSIFGVVFRLQMHMFDLNSFSLSLAHCRSSLYFILPFSSSPVSHCLAKNTRNNISCVSLFGQKKRRSRRVSFQPYLIA